MTNWKTTLGGILTAIGIGLTQSGNPTMQHVGAIAASIGALLAGGFARDFNVTSEESGVK